MQLLGDSILCSVLSLEYLHKNDCFVSCKNEIKAFGLKIKEYSKENYDSNWKDGVWFSKYWLIMYTDYKRWKLFETKGYGNTIFAHSSLDKDFTCNSIELMKDLYEFEIDFINL